MTPSRARCPRCLAEVIAGRTDAGFDVELDPTELDPLGELGVTVAGGVTYTRHTWAGVIAYRNPYAIRTRPAGSRPRQAVHAAHDCARPIPTPPRAAGTDRDEGGGAPLGDDPPF